MSSHFVRLSCRLGMGTGSSLSILESKVKITVCEFSFIVDIYLDPTHPATISKCEKLGCWVRDSGHMTYIQFCDLLKRFAISRLEMLYGRRQVSNWSTCLLWQIWKAHFHMRQMVFWLRGDVTSQLKHVSQNPNKLLGGRIHISWLSFKQTRPDDDK